MKNNLEYVVRQKFLDPDEVLLLSSFFNAAYDDANDAKKPHANVLQVNGDKVVSSKALGSVSKKIETYFTDQLGVTGICLAKCWLVKSEPKDTDPTKLPYLPHFDNHRYLKAMIYLHDVDISHGPIHFGKLISPAKIDIRRRKLPSNYKELGLNTIQQSDLKADMEPILGKKGDVIFFDTNAAHCGGIVSEGFERRVVRFDFDVLGFNSNSSLLRRFFNRVRSRIG